MGFQRAVIKAKKNGILRVIREGVRADTDRGWPTCQKCKREIADNLYAYPPVDSVVQIDETATTMTFRITHHDESEDQVVNFGRPFNDDDRSNAFKALQGFSPKLEGAPK